MTTEDALIDLVRENPMLYDTNHRDYHNHAEKERVWMQISIQMNETEEALKRKWNNMRDAYRKALLKKRPKHKRFKREDQMNFLQEHLSPRVLADVSKLQEERGVEFVEHEITNTAELSNGAQSLEIVPSIASFVSDCNSFSVEEMQETTPKAREEHSFQSPSCGEPTDHLAAFFKATEATVRTFSRLHQIQIKAEISSLLCQYEMKDFMASSQAQNS